jgi:hypothetical protein
MNELDDFSQISIEAFNGISYLIAGIGGRVFRGPQLPTKTVR